MRKYLWIFVMLLILVAFISVQKIPASALISPITIDTNTGFQLENGIVAGNWQFQNRVVHSSSGICFVFFYNSATSRLAYVSSIDSTCSTWNARVDFTLGNCTASNPYYSVYLKANTIYLVGTNAVRTFCVAQYSISGSTLSLIGSAYSYSLGSVNFPATGDSIIADNSGTVWLAFQTNTGADVIWKCTVNCTSSNIAFSLSTTLASSNCKGQLVSYGSNVAYLCAQSTGHAGTPTIWKYNGTAWSSPSYGTNSNLLDGDFSAVGIGSNVYSVMSNKTGSFYSCWFVKYNGSFTQRNLIANGVKIGGDPYCNIATDYTNTLAAVFTNGSTSKLHYFNSSNLGTTWSIQYTLSQDSPALAFYYADLNLSFPSTNQISVAYQQFLGGLNL